MKRNISLDALRGLAIIGMVLSGMIQQNLELPGWLFHAQVGPLSGFGFDPSITGITWVDLIFPMFLFAMGGAMSFSVSSAVDKGSSFCSFLKKLSARTLKLFLFALAVKQLHPWSISSAGVWGWVYALVSFSAMIAAFAKLPARGISDKTRQIINLSGIVTLIVLLVCRGPLFGKPFSLSQSDIIIVVLANVSLIGGCIYWFTRTKPLSRWAAMFFAGALFLTSGEGSWNSAVWNFSVWQLFPDNFFESGFAAALGLRKGAMFISVAYWKYLLILLPGTFAGDLLLNSEEKRAGRQRGDLLIILLSWSIVVWNVVFLYMRWTTVNFLATGVLSVVIYRAALRLQDRNIARLLTLGILLVFAGLVFEAHLGGIRKDFTTMGYLLLTPGLSVFITAAFEMASRNGAGFTVLCDIGRNPLIGYVAAGFVVIPLLALTHLLPVVDGLQQSWKWFALIRGLFITALMALITIVFTRKRIFLKI